VGHSASRKPRNSGAWFPRRRRPRGAAADGIAAGARRARPGAERGGQGKAGARNEGGLDLEGAGALEGESGVRFCLVPGGPVDDRLALGRCRAPESVARSSNTSDAAYC
jgi:hypothetical protein